MPWTSTRHQLLLATCLALLGCVQPSEPAEPTHGGQCEIAGDPASEGYGTVSAALTVSCAVKNATGYSSGKATAIQVVTVDGKPVEIHTANAYYVMAKAAQKDGVNLAIVSGFRTMAEQQYFYNCYKNCNCNSCNLAAKPGYSNHQSGHALDLNTSSSGVFNWLTKHGGAYGFKKTVPSENWHWEWWGGGPGGGICDACGSCDDKNVCTSDACTGNTCSHKAVAKACSDGNGCTIGDACSAGKCKAGKAKDCNDSNPCTDDGCKSDACTHKANAKACTDSNACSVGDVCSGGKCKAGKAKDCNDKNPCTADSCAAGQCVHSASAGPCDDANGCTGGDSCQGGKCAGGAAKDCNDSNPCTADSCAAGQCVHPASAGPCDDGDSCTEGEVCGGGACQGIAKACDDGLPCTTDSCAGGQCLHAGEVQVPGKVCVGADVGLTGPCGGAQVVEVCPAKSPCLLGVCTAIAEVDAGQADSAAMQEPDAGDADTTPVDAGVDAVDSASDGVDSNLGHPAADAAETADMAAADAAADASADVPRDAADAADATLGKSDAKTSKDAAGLQGADSSSPSQPNSAQADAPPSGCTAAPVRGSGNTWAWLLLLAMAGLALRRRSRDAATT